MQIALVGNGPVDHSHAAEIDSHDFVVRFNTAHHFGRSGRRTDALVITNTGRPALKMAESRGGVHPGALNSAREVWLARHPDLIAAESRRDPRTWEDHSQALIGNRLTGKSWRFIDETDYRAAHAELKSFGALDTHQPSTGMVALFHLQRLHSPISVTLFGFTHEGWHGHPWEAERAFVAANRLWIKTVHSEPQDHAKWFAPLAQVFGLTAQRSPTHST